MHKHILFAYKFFYVYNGFKAEEHSYAFYERYTHTAQNCKGALYVITVSFFLIKPFIFESNEKVGHIIDTVAEPYLDIYTLPVY